MNRMWCSLLFFSYFSLSGMQVLRDHGPRAPGLFAAVMLILEQELNELQQEQFQREIKSAKHPVDNNRPFSAYKTKKRNQPFVSQKRVTYFQPKNY